MKFLVTICARGGSKGIPGKNIKELAGKPLVAYTIDHARDFAGRCGGQADIALSTDSEDIKTVAARWGLTSDYLRPEYLAGDTAGKVDAIKDVLEHYESTTGEKYDYVLDLDVTSPLRTSDDLLEGFRILDSDPHALNLYSVSPASRNPYFNMVEKGEDGYYRKVKSAGNFKSRQQTPEVYDLNASFYFYRRTFFDSGKTVINDRSLVYVMPHICFDLDHPVDFDFISYLIGSNKLDFKI